METQKLDFREALEHLAQRAGITLSKQNAASAQEKSHRKQNDEAMAVALKFFRDSLANSQAAMDYCAGRSLDADTIQKWEIGYGPEMGEALAMHLKKLGFNLAACKELFLVEGSQEVGFQDRFRARLIFPIRDDRGHLVAFGGRLMGDGIPKYINSSDTPLYSKRRVLYGMHLAKDAISKKDRAVLVEGYLDAIACHRAGRSRGHGPRAAGRPGPAGTARGGGGIARHLPHRHHRRAGGGIEALREHATTGCGRR